MTISANVDSYRATIKLGQVTPRIMAALRTKRDALLLALEAKAKANAPVGPSTPTHTGGQLRRSIFSQADDTATSVEGKVATGAETPYARIQELGGKTAAHDIIPTKAKALAFVMGGELTFATVVHHPGSNIPAQLYMKRAIDDLRGTIVEQMTQAARDGASGG